MQLRFTLSLYGRQLAINSEPMCACPECGLFQFVCPRMTSLHLVTLGHIRECPFLSLFSHVCSLVYSIDFSSKVVSFSFNIFRTLGIALYFITHIHLVSHIFQCFMAL